IAAGVLLSEPSWLEFALLAIVAILALTIALLLKRHQWFHRALAAERRQLRTAVDNIPQGLVLYDASARIVACNQPYLDMFGLSADIARQGCTMQRLIEHRQETGSFDGDVDAFCGAIIRNVRLGGDEFAIIQKPEHGAADTERLVEAIYAAIRQPFECAGHLITTDASIGIAMAPGDGMQLDLLLKNADLALYGAKGDGRRTYRFFEPAMGARAHARRILELEM